MAMALALVSLSNCALDWPKRADARELDCAAEASMDLDVPSYRYFVAPAYFRTSGGLLRFEVSNLSTTILGEITSTTMYFGDEAEPPAIPDYVEPDPPPNADVRITVELDRPGTIDLPAGKYWALNSSGSIRVTHCEDVVLSEVEPGLWPPLGSVP